MNVVACVLRPGASSVVALVLLMGCGSDDPQGNPKGAANGGAGTEAPLEGCAAISTKEECEAKGTEQLGSGETSTCAWQTLRIANDASCDLGESFQACRLINTFGIGNCDNQDCPAASDTQLTGYVYNEGPAGNGLEVIETCDFGTYLPEGWSSCRLAAGETYDDKPAFCGCLCEATGE